MVSAAPPAPQPAVVVTGLGLATSLGFGVARTWERLLAGESAIAEQPPERFALPIALPVRLGAAVPRETLAAEIRRAVPRGVWNTSAPVCHLWLLAALEAMAAAGLPLRAGEGEEGGGNTIRTGGALDGAARTGVYVGCGGGAHGFAEEEYIRVYTAEKPSQRDVSRFAIPMYMSSSLAGQLSILAGLRGPAQVFNTACSSGVTALLAALDALRAGRVERAVAGGVDLTLSAATLKGFYNIGALATRNGNGPGACRPFDAERDGLVLGEGAGCLVLERADGAAARGARARAVLLGGASNAEAHHLLAPRDEGEGMAECIVLALADAGVEPGRVAHVYAHGTGTRFNDRCEAAALAHLFPHRPTVSASKELLGHTLGAAGAIDAALAVLGLESGRVVPLRYLDTPDPDCPVHPAREAAHPRLGEALDAPPDGGAPVVLVNAFAFGGHNVSLLFGAAPQPAPRERP
jgi:3-oxoacyl-[acyl-carrier-protein] synthase II